MSSRSASKDATPDLAESYAAVMGRVGAAAERSGRRAEDVLVVAVSKYAELDQLRTLVDLGHVDFGENQVQQLAQRAPQLSEYLARHRAMRGASSSGSIAPERIRWHMVGHLQRNKVKQCVPHVQLIHSVDSLRLAEELHNHGAKHDADTDVLLQVNVSGEGTKNGVAPAAVVHLLEQIDTMMHLRCRGLMTMAPHHENPEDCRAVFARTRELFEDCRGSRYAGDRFNILSMGMSNDFEVAIEEGANLVRVGSALFGTADAGG
ncbi:YggS family pyridoxal phosphate-dependent enzyme [Phycisphaera mikurensis]|uniref:Pyridoxal phosphate homeostasis protein n=1 Tax=Phycisphaera mikurensis (strain NBRC 102666 / KCTC 22515 / FYK2301M01) TaxID=1142394 RepID=I0IIM8_PHYMF|nr:YggS family pyridoxal phosphate-dependent enzyme [Phycisphaera mikurensis]MBB6442732.1 hypothetical protein [Phycisphaera mikurensis]BAM05116.1 hypothetical protein PSMK_29570 [Phycisphaera mikurensis NBRC 102666]